MKEAKDLVKTISEHPIVCNPIGIPVNKKESMEVIQPKIDALNDALKKNKSE